MSCYMLTGQRFNLLENATSFTPNPAADALFPASEIADGDPGSVFKYGSLTAAPDIYFDLDAMADTGGFESWSAGSPVGYTEANTGTSDVTQTSVAGEFHSGASAAKFTAAGAGRATIYRDIELPAGSVWTARYWARGDGGTGATELYVQNLKTGKYAITSTTWSATPQRLAVGTTSTTYAQVVTGGFTVENYAACRSDVVTIRITLANIVNGTVSYADDLECVPYPTFASIHGHNIDPLCTLKLQRGNAVGVWADIVTFTVVQPSFYSTFTLPDFYRYFRLLFSGTNSTASGPIYIGEAVLGSHLTLATGPAYSMSLPHSDPQILVPKRVGAPSVYQLSQFNQRSFPISLRAENMTRRLEILQEVFERSRGGHPLVVVPHHTDSFTEVLYGRLSGDLPHSWATKNYVTMETEVQEMAFPLVTSG